MKKLLIVLIAAGAGWWHFHGGRTLSDSHAHAFYRDLEAAILNRKPDNICNLLDPAFQSTATATMGGKSYVEAQDKAQACDAYRNLYATWEQMGQKMGGTLHLDSSYTVHSVSISPDKKTATVDFSSSLAVAGTLMRIRSRSTHTLVRRNGKVLLLQSQGTGSIGSGP